MRQASYAARNAALLQRGTPHAARKSARVFLHSAQPPRAASCSHCASGFFLPHHARRLPKYPLKAQSHPARGAHEAALSFPFSQSRDISRRFQRALSKIRVPKAFRSSGANTVCQAPFHAFRQTTANHTPRGCRTRRAESALSCGTKGTKNVSVRAERINFFALHENGFRAQLFMREKGVHVPVRIVFRERRAVQF